MSDPANTQPTNNAIDPLTLYTRSLHNYTLALWTESRRVAEEKARAQQAATDQQPILSQAEGETAKEAAQVDPSMSSSDKQT
ncbi:hypothetical protein GALMADRAFT_218729 [Galerina marginata CBS 339.88]|uniref:Uncharacterized protein n=1 Tax=Galerina marginata (strain CBS 339.88) TaxID=685588 RepID=A0A067U009_GALM3|nr:hypothetical protein GALMADRAFT_218729 [Galerina marginata CBS 339.88]